MTDETLQEIKDNLAVAKTHLEKAQDLMDLKPTTACVTCSRTDSGDLIAQYKNAIGKAIETAEKAPAWVTQIWRTVKKAAHRVARETADVTAETSTVPPTAPQEVPEALPLPVVPE